MNRFDGVVRRHPELRQWTRVAEETLTHLRAEYPGVPDDYVSFLREVGAGKSSFPTFRLYGGLSPASDLFGPDNPAIDHVLIFGDDYQGFISGFNANWEVVQFDSADGPVEVVCQSFEEFVEMMFSE